MSDLFDGVREAKRARLREAGWDEIAVLTPAGWSWRRSDGAMFTEEEAFRQLDREDQANGGAHG